MNHPISSCHSHLQEIFSLAEELRQYQSNQTQPQPGTQFEDENNKPWSQNHPQPGTEPGDESNEPWDQPDPLAAPFDGDVVMEYWGEQIINNEAEHHGHFAEYFEGAAKTYVTGTTFMKKFDMDEFAEMRTENLYYPFASRAEWEFASFLLRSDLSMAAIDNLLSLSLVSTFSVKSHVFKIP